jgi:hypothetical protein
MGLYFARPRRTIPDEPSASITWHEYMSALSAAADPGASIAAGIIHPDGPARLAVARALDGTEMVRLRTQLRRRPEEETIHRLLGLGYLARGRIELAVRHLEIALGLVGTEMQRAVGLTEAVRLQFEAATLRLVLIRLHGRLGNEARARALAREVQAAL